MTTPGAAGTIASQALTWIVPARCYSGTENCSIIWPKTVLSFGCREVDIQPYVHKLKERRKCKQKNEYANLGRPSGIFSASRRDSIARQTMTTASLVFFCKRRRCGERGTFPTSAQCYHRWPTSWCAGQRTCTQISRGAWREYLRHHAETSTRGRKLPEEITDDLEEKSKKKGLACGSASVLNCGTFP